MTVPVASGAMSPLAMAGEEQLAMLAGIANPFKGPGGGAGGARQAPGGAAGNHQCFNVKDPTMMQADAVPSHFLHADAAERDQERHHYH